MNKLSLAAGILVLLAVKFFYEHRDEDYKGDYRMAGNYSNVSPLKHDLFKSAFVELFPLMVMGFPSGEKFFDSDNILESTSGKIGLVVMSYFIFYEMVQPYMVQRL